MQKYSISILVYFYWCLFVAGYIYKTIEEGIKGVEAERINKINRERQALVWQLFSLF